jgi:spore cortex formation protein SpoVR/YcgB (stage V sporulation)
MILNFKEIYRSMDDDSLVNTYLTSELIEEASFLIQEELRSRGINTNKSLLEDEYNEILDRTNRGVEAIKAPFKIYWFLKIISAGLLLLIGLVFLVLSFFG